MTALHQSMAIPKPSFSILVIRTKYKDAITDVSDSSQNTKTSCKSKLKL